MFRAVAVALVALALLVAWAVTREPPRFEYAQVPAFELSRSSSASEHTAETLDEWWVLGREAATRVEDTSDEDGVLTDKTALALNASEQALDTQPVASSAIAPVIASLPETSSPPVLQHSEFIGDKVTREPDEPFGPIRVPEIEGTLEENEPAGASSEATQPAVGWVFGQLVAGQYELGTMVDPDQPNNRIAFIRSAVENPAGWAWIRQTVSLSDWQNYRILVHRRSRVTNVVRVAEPTMMAIREGSVSVYHGDMQWARSGTTRWIESTLNTDVGDAVRFVIGGYLSGPGEVYFDDLWIEPQGAPARVDLVVNSDFERVLQGE